MFSHCAFAGGDMKPFLSPQLLVSTVSQSTPFCPFFQQLVFLMLARTSTVQVYCFHLCGRLFLLPTSCSLGSVRACLLESLLFNSAQAIPVESGCSQPLSGVILSQLHTGHS